MSLKTSILFVLIKYVIFVEMQNKYQSNRVGPKETTMQLATNHPYFPIWEQPSEDVHGKSIIEHCTISSAKKLQIMFNVTDNKCTFAKSGIGHIMFQCSRLLKEHHDDGTILDKYWANTPPI